LIELIVSLFLLAVISLSALVWSTHQYTYPSKNQIINGMEERRFDEPGTYWSVVRGYQLYQRGTGKLLRSDVSPLRGLLRAIPIGLLLLISGFAVIQLWKVLGDPGVYTRVWLYILIMFFTIEFVFPDQFVKHANLPGRVIDFFKGDFPFSLMWWGLPLSLYGALIILNHNGINDIPFVEIKLSAIRGKTAMFGAPAAWLGGAFAFEVVFLKPSPRMITWRLFFASWFIAAIGCWLMVIHMI